MTDKFGTKMTNIEWLTDQAAKLRISANPCAGETPLTAMADRFDRAATEITRLRDAAESALAWLDTWAQHVGTCPDGQVCTCGLDAIRYELRAPLQPPS